MRYAHATRTAISYQPLALAIRTSSSVATLREQFMGYTHGTRSVVLNKISCSRSVSEKLTADR
ncbi:MAG: hypothetical protein F6K53_37745 [Moorea sp. SIO4A1]|uniref:hypothetical protein n=1 Tax=Moorena sp. SIO4A1 TaxID=2607835 RepID=UPI001451030E|nr:hypothetical protein [Moorena sp. SIO4A1]NEQ62806.1 hypothetical protein [Moorena sp. SIO4A1]